MSTSDLKRVLLKSLEYSRNIKDAQEQSVMDRQDMKLLHRVDLEPHFKLHFKLIGIFLLYNKKC